MADLIDRAALLEQLESFRADEKWRKKRTLRERWLRTIGIDIFAEAVKKFPSVDAVPVVRCKDCRKRDTVECEMEYKYEEYPWKATKDNDFCSSGERRTDATN